MFRLGPGHIEFPLLGVQPDRLPSDAEEPHDNCQENQGCRDQRSPVAAAELSQPIEPRLRPGLQRIPAEVATQILRQRGRGVVAIPPTLSQRLERNPFQFTAQQLLQFIDADTPRLGDLQTHFRGDCAQTSAWSRGCILLDHALDLGVPPSTKLRPFEGNPTGQELVEHHAQRVDITAGVGVDRTHRSLFGAHVLEFADHRTKAGMVRMRMQRLTPDRLGDAEVDHLDLEFVVLVERGEDVRGGEVPVDHTLLMRMLDCITDLREELQSLGGREAVPVAEFGDRFTTNIFHDEVGTTRLGGPRLEHTGNTRVVHQGERLPLGFEALDHLLGIHPGLDDLERDLSLDGLGLLREVDDAEAPLTERVDQGVLRDGIPHLRISRRLAGEMLGGGTGVGSQHRLHLDPLGTREPRLVEVRGTLGHGKRYRLVEESPDPFVVVTHGSGFLRHGRCRDGRVEHEARPDRNASRR